MMMLGTYRGDDMNRELFDNVFRDAKVLDLDFSTWDCLIRMVVVATEMPAVQGRLPLYIVEFQRVHHLEISFAHYGIHLESGHFQWSVFETEIKGSEGSFVICLSSTKEFPVTILECEDVSIRPLKHHVLDKRFPGWNKPGGPLVRPGVEDLAKERVRRS